MALWKRSVAALSDRLSSKQGRFTFAVSLGFVLTAVGVMSTAFDARSGRADGFLESLFGGSLLGQQSPYAMAGYGEPAQRRVSRRRSATRGASIRFVAAHHRPARAQGEPSGDPSFAQVRVSTNAQSVCVRTCDGFAFPVGAYHGASDLAAHEATCHAECPGAATSLYLLPANADAITAAVSLRTGQNYSKLPDAFHYTTVLDAACSCHPAAGGAMKSLLHDFTLRRGDAVMTDRGVRVFHGGAHYPFHRQDFVALNQSRDVAKDARATFRAIERASLIGDPGIAARRAHAPAAVSTMSPVGSGTRQLEHQASR